MKQNTRIAQWLLTAALVCAMIFLFFRQARLVLHPVPVAFEHTDIAFGYSVNTFSGTIYHDEGTTPVGAGSGVALHVNGAASKTTTTNTSGQYSFSNVTLFANDVVTVFLDNEPDDGVLVAKFNSGAIEANSITGMDIYIDRLILRVEDSDIGMTTTNLNTADNAGDADVSAIYSISGTDLKLKKGKELYIWDDTTHTTSGSIFTHDLEVKGTLTTGASNIVASGSFVIPGTLSTSGDTTLTSVDSGEVLQVNGTSLNNLYIDSGIDAFFRMDEGTGLNLSGATLSTATGGSISGATWTQANTGTTIYYNPYALEFDGVDDVVTFGDAYDIDDSSTKRTFTGWFRRKSATSEDIIFAKKSGSGSSAAGYMLWLDDADDKLYFEVANGTNDYLVASNTTITDESWHHFAVSYNPLNTAAINIFIDGAIDVSSKTGSLESAGAISGTFSNSVEFQLGDTATSSGPFHGTLDDFRIYTRAMSGSEVSQLASGLKSTGSGTYYVRSNLDVNGDFCAYAGILDFGTGYSLNVAGDYCNYAGDVRTNSGTIILDGSDQAIRGSTAFNNLTKSNTTSVTLTFEANTLQTFSGTLILQGALSNTMDLVSSRTGSQAYLIRDSGATVLKYLDVIDSNALSGGLLSCTEGCIDSENNNNWEFLSECGDGVVSGSEQCDDGDDDNNDTCPNDCQLAVCGDNVLEGLEECEPPNAGTCLSNCLLRSSGGGGGGGNVSAGSAASYYNRPAPPDGCGNGILETEKGEECDAGDRFNGLGTCSFDCKKLLCGDGTISPQIGEDCEPKIKGQRDGVTIYEVATCGETCTAPETTKQGTVFGGCKRLFLPACGAQSSSSSKKPSAPSACGNGKVDAGEECDFGGICRGGSFDGSFWTDQASASTCVTGGGTPEPASGDGCSAQCLSEFCGDGFVQERGADNQPDTDDDEQCDNGSVCSNDKTKSCRLNSECPGGECQYDTSDNTLCSTSCKATTSKPKPAAKPSAATCGNGKVESGEECDGGAGCNEFCKRIQIAETPAPVLPRCGDGIIQGDEACDNGDANSDINPNACRTNCSLPTCGDFIVDNGEQCDNGVGNSDFTPDTCRTSCTLPYCGDGIVDSGEQCDGNLSCTPSCVYVKRVVEQSAPPVVKPRPVDEPVVKRSAPPALELEADVVVVNPEEYANALKFVGTTDPCSVLVMKGKDQKALLIREAAVRLNIPIVKNIPLARALYASIQPGQQIFGSYCDEINQLKPGYQESAPPPPPPVPEQPLPQAPTMMAYGFYNYAQVQPMVTANPPAGETGPAAVGIIVAGAAGGLGWMRRKRQ